MRIGVPLRIDASAIQRSPSSVTTTVPWFGPTMSGRGIIVAIPSSTSNPSASSRSCSAPFPAQHVPPVPWASHESKKSSAVVPGSGPGRPFGDVDQLERVVERNGTAPGAVDEAKTGQVGGWAVDPEAGEDAVGKLGAHMFFIPRSGKNSSSARGS